MSDFDRALAASFRQERAVAAARRFISRSVGKNEIVRVDDVAAFLRRRREALADDEVSRCATAAMSQYGSVTIETEAVVIPLARLHLARALLALSGACIRLARRMAPG